MLVGLKYVVSVPSSDGFLDISRSVNGTHIRLFIHLARILSGGGAKMRIQKARLEAGGEEAPPGQRSGRCWEGLQASPQKKNIDFFLL